MRNNEGASKLESVDRALQLIVLLRDGEVLTVKSAAEQLDVVPSTAHRLLGALCDRGFAVQHRDRRYQAGPELHTPAGDSVSLTDLRRAARPALEWLNASFGETAQLMVINGPRIQFVDGLESPGALRVGVRIGDQMPAYCSAGGKALLASLPDEDVAGLYPSGLTPWPAARITEVPELLQQLGQVRTFGYGVNIDETEDGVCGVGVCIHHRTDRPVGAMTLALPTTRFHKNDLQRYADDLREAADMTRQRLHADS